MNKSQNQIGKFFDTVQMVCEMSDWAVEFQGDNGIVMSNNAWQHKFASTRGKESQRNPSEAIFVLAKGDTIHSNGLEHLGVGYGEMENGGLWFVQGTKLFHINAVDSKLYATVRD